MLPNAINIDIRISCFGFCQPVCRLLFENGNCKTLCKNCCKSTPGRSIFPCIGSLFVHYIENSFRKEYHILILFIYCISGLCHLVDMVCKCDLIDRAQEKNRQHIFSSYFQVTRFTCKYQKMRVGWRKREECDAFE